MRLPKKVEHKTVLGLEHNMCRWPVGFDSNGRHLFCCECVVAMGRPYCATHTQVAYQPLHPRRIR